MLHTADIPLDGGMCIAERLAFSYLYHATMVHALPEMQGPDCRCKMNRSNCKTYERHNQSRACSFDVCVGSACRSLNVTVALYCQGALLLADTISEGNSRVLLVGRDLTIPPVGTSTGSGSGLREFVCEISPPTAGTAYQHFFVVFFILAVCRKLCPAF